MIAHIIIEENIKLRGIEIEKKKMFHQNEEPISIKNIDLNKIK